MSYTIIIRKNSTGEIRHKFEDYEWGENSDFLWTEGNYGCDCNRALHFLWANGEDEEEDDPGTPCGETEYSCWAKMPDGSIVSLDDRAEEGGPPTLSSDPAATSEALSRPGTE